MKKTLFVLNLLAGLVLTRFTISKFAAWPVSVAGFVDMAKPLGIDPTIFRIATGFVIGIAATAHFTTALIALREKADTVAPLLAFNVLWSVGAMTGALGAEFFLRTQVKWPLVFIALGVHAVSLSNVKAYRGDLLRLLRGSASFDRERDSARSAQSG